MTDPEFGLWVGHVANVLEDFHGAMDYDAAADYAASAPLGRPARGSGAIVMGSSRAIVRASSEFSLRSASSRACCTAATATRWARPTRAWLGSDSGSTRYASNRGVSPLQGTLGVVGVIAFYLAANIPHLPVAIGGDLRAAGAAVGAVRIGQLRAPRSTSAASAIGRSAG